jgi:hypothetical protein
MDVYFDIFRNTPNNSGKMAVSFNELNPSKVLAPILCSENVNAHKLE